jgi:3-oxoacyl-[acyl-carrier protein] reductase
MQDQSGKQWILVTGGTRGIGKGLVECLASSGYRIMFTYRQSQDEAHALSQRLAADGFDARGFRCDGTNPEEVKTVCTELVSKFGAPLALINNAGITQDALLYNMPLESWDKVVDANLRSTFLFTKLILPSMMEARNGVILNMSSVTAIRGNIGQTNYGATKAAMLGMTRSLALETARFNIRVNCILPGLVETEMVEQIPEKDRLTLKKKIPLKRLCGVAEVGGLVKYLISDIASYITGQALSIDGGLTV